MLKFLTVDQVGEIVRAAEALNAKHPSTDAVVSGSDITMEDIVAYSSDEKPLTKLINALGDDARFELMALMWVGRGEWDDFPAAVEYARKNSDEGDVPYIADKAPALPTYFRAGLKKIGIKVTV